VSGATQVLIVDSGGANLASLSYALERLGADARVSADPQEIAAAARVILPGVGSAKSAMARLQATGLARVLLGLTQPVLGICLGMQLLFERSDEGPTECLGLVPDDVRRLPHQADHPVPHMGWNQLEVRAADPLLDGLATQTYMYFVHSFAAPVSQYTLASVDYGRQLAAVIRRNNFWGTQFHPERSSTDGARLLANFLRIG
jgi:imidazole glycerol-phosphate synthase subunit HisH